jgi:hypothetical protein
MLQRTLLSSGKAYPTQTNDDVLVYHCNDGARPAALVNSGSYGTSNYTSPITATTTTANFTTPFSYGGSVTINVASSVGYHKYGHVKITGAGYYWITNIPSSTQLTCMDMAYADYPTLNGMNPRSTVISSGATVAPVIENSPTTTTSNFTQPADVYTDLYVFVSSTAGFRNGNQIYISSGGYYQISRIAGATLMVVRLVSVSTNTAGGTTILSGATVTANADFTRFGSGYLSSCAGPFTRAVTLVSWQSAAGLEYNITYNNSPGPQLFGCKMSLSCWTRYVPVSTLGHFFGRQDSDTGWTGADCFLDVVDATSSCRWGLNMQNNAAQGPTQFFNVDNGVGARYLAINSWNYIVATMDLSLMTDNIKLYLNGTLVRTFSSSNGGVVAWNQLFWSDYGLWELGNVRNSSTGFYSSDGLKGALAECRLTQGVLTAQQISDIWNTANAYLL